MRVNNRKLTCFCWSVIPDWLWWTKRSSSLECVCSVLQVHTGDPLVTVGGPHLPWAPSTRALVSLRDKI